MTADRPLHLEDHLEAAKIEVPDDLPSPVAWNFGGPQPDWKPIVPLVTTVEPAQTTRMDDSLRVTLTAETEYKEWDVLPVLCGGIYVDLPDWKREDWGDILVRARTTDEIEDIAVGFNLRREIGPEPFEDTPFRFTSGGSAVIRDDTRAWWQDHLEPDPEEIEEGESAATNDAEGLRKFLEGDVMSWYEVHLDRKLERMLAMLIRLKDLRGEVVDS